MILLPPEGQESGGVGVFSVDYHGQPIEFSPLYEGEALQGYVYRCPTGQHRGQNWLDTESGTHHVLTRDAAGRVTIRASLLCPQGCGWHVFITDSVAVDA